VNGWKVPYLDPLGKRKVTENNRKRTRRKEKGIKRVKTT
jgi:hypothetical protein